MRRIFWIGVVVIVAVGFGVWLRLVPSSTDSVAPAWYSRTVYPLEHGVAIRAAAKKYKVDPALVAAVIYVESGFDEDARSAQGAVGLMQVLPATAQEIASRTGGSAFSTGDLENPRINVRYGTYYLRTVLDEFDGDTLSAVAAYNAGGGAVGEWTAAAQAKGRSLRAADIPYAETRAYVSEVLRVRKLYRENYGEQLTAPL
ncbi:MAG TPA: lytic transglycosylase domain-containing protein [Thermoleophilia bacterium]|nr:lytic transglycosylase domain-containing protein [Thermoleophilia bacterium]